MAHLLSWCVKIPSFPVACFQSRKPIPVNALSPVGLKNRHGKQNTAFFSTEYSSKETLHTNVLGKPCSHWQQMIYWENRFLAGWEFLICHLLCQVANHSQNLSHWFWVKLMNYWFQFQTHWWIQGQADLDRIPFQCHCHQDHHHLQFREK